MKKIYLFVLTLFFSIAHYGQAPIATIDRANGTGPTATGTVANMTATGMTRTGVVQTTGVSFSSNNWETSATRSTSKYIQWSITANATYMIRLSQLDIRFRRTNNQAPKQIQVYYSLDGFSATGANPNGFPIGIVETFQNNNQTLQTRNISISNVSSTYGGTITFRLYGWDAANVNGNLIIEDNTDWAGLGIANPGIRVQGNLSRLLTYSAGAWTPYAPSTTTGFDDGLVQDGTYMPASDVSLNNLAVSPIGSLSIPSGVTVTTVNTSFQSNSTQYSSLILDGALTGTLSYNRHVNGQPGVGVGTGANDLISAPLTGQTFSVFAAANPNLRANPNNNNQKMFGPFNKTTGTYQIWDVTVNGAETLNPGVGYRAASTDNGGFIFNGTVNTGNVTHNIVNAGPQFASYNLIGNPYPSYINVREFLEYDVDAGAATVRNIDLMVTNNAAIYGYDGDASGNGGDGWVVYNLNTPTTVNMTPGQGFLVTADATDVAAYDMTFTPSMRRIDNTDDFIPGRMANENNAHLRLNAFIGNSNHKTDFYFNENSTSALDFGYDAAVFGSNAASKAIYSHLVESNTGVDMAIQSLNHGVLGTDIVIPLGINASEGQQVTVSITESSLPSNIEVYLEDNVTGTFTLLNTNDYIFTPNSNLVDTGRFYLHFSNSTLSNPDLQISGLEIYTTNSPKTLYVNGRLDANASLNLFDIQGRLVLTSALDSLSNSNKIDIANLNVGVYVAQVNSGAQQKTQKIIVK